jgi:hypothetical protein
MSYQPRDIIQCCGGELPAKVFLVTYNMIIDGLMMGLYSYIVYVSEYPNIVLTMF